jgi:tetratricopeptide (TPR) repeat protein
MCHSIKITGLLTPNLMQSTWFRMLAGLTLAAITFAAYIPAVGAGFIWDDDIWVTDNPLLSAPDGLRRIWFSTDSPSQYFPMVYTSFRFEYALWQLNPKGYHITNILLHAINAVLLWHLLRCLAIPGAWLAAAIFALHPVQVESVAWITERKNVLMTFFSLLSLFAWLRFISISRLSRRIWYLYGLSLLIYVFALLSKTTACTLPAALVLLLWLRRIRITVKHWLQIVPYVLLGLGMGILTIWWEKYHQGTGLVELGINPVERMLVAARALWFYLGKLVWPTNLTFSYPKWQIDSAACLQYSWLLAWLIAGWGIWHWRNKLGRGVIVAIVFFAATLSPMLGFLSLYTFLYTYVADHYQYAACIGPITLVAAISCVYMHKLGVWEKTVAMCVAGVVLVILGTLTWQQCHVYKDLETLWHDTLKKNPAATMAYYNFTNLLLRQGRFDEAIGYYQEALELDPNNADAHNNLGMALQSQARLKEAIMHYRRALQIKPDFAKAHNNLGLALALQDRVGEAIDHFNQALEIAPGLVHARINLADTLLRRGMLEQAIKQYQQVLDVTPKNARVHNDLGTALARHGRLDEAVTHFTESLRIEPDNADAHYNLALALADSGDIDKAVKHCNKALQAKPDFDEVRALRKTLLQDPGGKEATSR